MIGGILRRAPKSFDIDRKVACNVGLVPQTCACLRLRKALTQERLGVDMQMVGQARSCEKRKYLATHYMFTPFRDYSREDGKIHSRAFVKTRNASFRFVESICIDIGYIRYK